MITRRQECCRHHILFIMITAAAAASMYNMLKRYPSIHPSIFVSSFGYTSSTRRSRHFITNKHRTTSSLISIQRPFYGVNDVNSLSHRQQQQHYCHGRLFATSSSSSVSTDSPFFSQKHVTFESMGVDNPVLLDRLAKNLNVTRPSAVQVSSYAAIQSRNNVIIGAETGSGKTLAYLLPLINDIFLQKSSINNPLTYSYCRALILVPNKELVQQVRRMASALSSSDDLRIGVFPGGFLAPADYKPFREALLGKAPPLDLVIGTPATLAPLALSPRHVEFFSNVETVVIDEADMLLEGGYGKDLDKVLMGFRRADKLCGDGDDDDGEFYGRKTQHVFCAATLPNSGLRSVDAFLGRKFPDAERVYLGGLHNARHYGLRERTRWREVEERGERLDLVVEELEKGKEKVMVFLNTVEDVDGVTNALRRSGINALPYHAKIPQTERMSNLETFRYYNPSSPTPQPPVLICTDLASRGLDIPGVTFIIQLQFATNVVAHLHRMGRCGRAGCINGKGLIFYGERERELVEVVREAEMIQEGMVLDGGVVVEEYDEETGSKVQKAFSRRRGFKKRIKKERRRDG